MFKHLKYYSMLTTLKCYTTSNFLSYLQKDLESLHLWSQSNIAFNSAKTTQLRFSTVSCHIPVNLLFNDQEISQSNHQRDPDIIISGNLSWSSHYTSIVSKALNTLGLIRRTVGTSSSIQVRKLLYIILVRSQVTYCSPVWRPHQIKDNILLESVQQKPPSGYLITTKLTTSQDYVLCNYFL